MHPISAAGGRARRAHCLLGLCAAGVLVTVACGHTENGSSAAGGSSGSSEATAGSAGAPVGNGGRAPHEAGGAAGSDDAAGAAGELLAGAAGEAGAPGEGFTCSPGGALFVAGNYVDASGNDFLLRVGATAATLALVPKGVAVPGKLPQLYLVERACAPGGALVVRDETSYFRVDFAQTGSRLALCFAPAPTLKDALQAAPADPSRATDTGCLGKPFQLFSQGAL